MREYWQAMMFGLRSGIVAGRRQRRRRSHGFGHGMFSVNIGADVIMFIVLIWLLVHLG